MLLADEGTLFNYTLPENTFYDNNDVLTSNLTLSLLDANGSPLPADIWVNVVQPSNGPSLLQGLPLSTEIIGGFVTDHVFVLQATDSSGSKAQQPFTIRVFPQSAPENFIQVLIEGIYSAFLANLSARLELTAKLSGEEGDIYVGGFESGSIRVRFSNLSIPNGECVLLEAWFRTIFSNNNYTEEFRNRIAPFIPIQTASIIGPCNQSEPTEAVNTLAPTLGAIGESGSLLVVLLATLVPALVLACLLLLIGAIGLATYRRTRPERRLVAELGMEKALLKRKPVYIVGELEGVPYRSRKPVILTDELQRRNQQGYSLLSAQRGHQPPTMPQPTTLDESSSDDSADDELVSDLQMLIPSTAHPPPPTLPTSFPPGDPPPYKYPDII